MPNIYPEQVDINMMKCAEHGSTHLIIHKRVMINFTKEACDLCRELNFQNNSEWSHKISLKNLDWRCFDLNFLEKYATGISPHKFYFDLNSIHSLYCFWAYEDGMWYRHTKYQISSFVYQGLNYQRDKGVSSLITNAIRLHLPKYATMNNNDVFR